MSKSPALVSIPTLQPSPSLRKLSQKFPHSPERHQKLSSVFPAQIRLCSAIRPAFHRGRSYPAVPTGLPKDSFCNLYRHETAHSAVLYGKSFRDFPSRNRQPSTVRTMRTKDTAAVHSSCMAAVSFSHRLLFLTHPVQRIMSYICPYHKRPVAHAPGACFQSRALSFY